MGVLSESLTAARERKEESRGGGGEIVAQHRARDERSMREASCRVYSREGKGRKMGGRGDGGRAEMKNHRWVDIASGGHRETADHVCILFRTSTSDATSHDGASLPTCMHIPHLRNAWLQQQCEGIGESDCRLLPCLLCGRGSGGLGER